jgi:type II secretory pathway pseudopilin PulG
MVVIAIISVLATIILPGMGRIRRDARMIKCGKNLTGLYGALINYESDFKGFPRSDFSGKRFWEALRQIPTQDSAIIRAKDYGMFTCPVKGTTPVGIDSCDYRGPADPDGYVGYQLDDADPIGADIETNHGKLEKKIAINVLYWGGTVDKLSFDDPRWEEINEQLAE